MANKFDSDYYSERARQERDLAEGASHPAAANAHDELAQLYEEVSKVGTPISSAMCLPEQDARAGPHDHN